MEFFSTGIEAVDRIGHINISGDVKPRIWHKTIVNEQGKPQRLAMDILSEIVYWYRPQEVRDERTGEVIGWKKRFAGDMLQKDYNYFVDNYGESEKTISRALAFLEDLGVIIRHRKSIRLKSGTIAHNVLFIELVADRLYELTYPQKEDVATKGTGNISEEYEIIADEDEENADKMGVSTGRSNLSNYSDKNVQGLRQNCPSGKTKMSEDSDRIVQVKRQNCPTAQTELSKGLDRNDPTNTYTTTESTSEITTHNTTEIKTISGSSVSTSLSLSEKGNARTKADADVDIDAITAKVNDLIDFNLLFTDFDNPEVEYNAAKDEFNGILEEVRDVLVYEVFAAPDDKRFNFGNREEPDFKSNAIVKNVFNKHLGYGTVLTYITQYLNNSTQVKKVTMYHIKSLYRQCLTQSSQYMSGGRSFFARES